MVSLLKNQREDFQKKWNDIKVVLEYGVISDDKFAEKTDKFMLYPNVDGQFHTWDELNEKIKDNQTDKDGKLVLLYTTDKDAQDAYIQSAQEKSYEVLLMDSPIAAHFIQKMEYTKEKIAFARVDADHISNLIKKDEPKISILSDEQKESLKTAIESSVDKEKYTVQLEDMSASDSPFVITQPEFIRRMKDMQQTGGGMFGMGGFPEMYNLVVNTNSGLATEILNKPEEEKTALINQALDLAKLSQNLLKGKELTDFIKRSFDRLK